MESKLNGSIVCVCGIPRLKSLKSLMIYDIEIYWQKRLLKQTDGFLDGRQFKLPWHVGSYHVFDNNLSCFDKWQVSPFPQPKKVI